MERHSTKPKCISDKRLAEKAFPVSYSNAEVVLSSTTWRNSGSSEKRIHPHVRFVHVRNTKGQIFWSADFKLCTVGGIIP